LSRFARYRDEEGATLVVVTLATILLFGLAALAVDVGHGMGERRRAQSTADASVLAAAVQVNLPGTSLQDLVDQALLFADNNAPDPIPESDWLNNCPDTANPGDQLEHTAAELGLTPATDCISFNMTFSEIRVALPQQIVDTFFAGVIGIDQFDVTAFAHSRLGLPGLADSPPFVALRSSTGGDERCLRASSISVRLPARWVGNGPAPADVAGYDINNDPVVPDPCDEIAFPLDPQFQGTFNPFRYEADPCKRTEGAAPTGLPLEIAKGVDHLFGTFAGGYSDGDTELFDGGPPNSFKCETGLPNTIELDTGDLSSLTLKRGFLTTNAATPRLKLNEDNYRGAQFAGELFDNKPLWEYLNGAGGTECVYARNNSRPPVAQYDHFDRKEDLLQCLSDSSSGQIIDGSIVTSSRFAWIPYVAENQLTQTGDQLLPGPSGGGRKYLHINSFVPIFFNTLYQVGRQGSQSDECWTQHPDASQGWSRHDAGQLFSCGSSAGGKGVHAVSAIIIPCGALPDTICTPDGVSGSPGGFPVLAIELTK
jgi:hypothetical protein